MPGSCLTRFAKIKSHLCICLGCTVILLSVSAVHSTRDYFPYRNKNDKFWAQLRRLATFRLVLFCRKLSAAVILRSDPMSGRGVFFRNSYWEGAEFSANCKEFILCTVSQLNNQNAFKFFHFIFLLVMLLRSASRRSQNLRTDLSGMLDPKEAAGVK